MGRGPRYAKGDGRMKKSDKQVRPDTLLAQGGRRKEWTLGVVNPPVFRASTILFDDVADMRSAAPKDGRLFYGRSGTPTQWALAEALTDLEPGAAGTRLFPSGVAAIAVALKAVLRPGDELLMVDSTYSPTRAFCDDVLVPDGVSVRYYDPLIGAGIETLITDRTRAIFLESPGSLTFEVQDVPGICEVAKRHGIVTLVDNTWATPLLFPALAAGVDISILACTKYVVGHSDVMIGSVTANAEWWDAIVRTTRAFGQHISPDDAYLALRGLRTMGVRLRQHEESALRVARWLKEQPQVGRVLHPALPDCPGHEYWTRDFKGSSGLFAFEMKDASDAQRASFIDGLRHFGIGYSWGGFESLVTPVDLTRIRTATARAPQGPLVRLHIGLEDAEDLIADLAEGLARI